MIVTEEEAKKKFCPMMRVQSNSAAPSANCCDGAYERFYEKCIASDCMMWADDKESDFAANEGHCGLAK